MQLCLLANCNTEVGCQTVKCKCQEVVVTMQTNEANPPIVIKPDSHCVVTTASSHLHFTADCRNPATVKSDLQNHSCLLCGSLKRELCNCCSGCLLQDFCNLLYIQPTIATCIHGSVHACTCMYMHVHADHMNGNGLATLGSTIYHTRIVAKSTMPLLGSVDTSY